MKRKKNPTRVRQILGSSSACSDKLTCTPLVRQVFYNESLYQDGPKTKAKTRSSTQPRPSRARRYLHWGLNGLIAAAGLVLVFYFIPSIFFKFLPGLNQSRVIGEATPSPAELLAAGEILFDPTGLASRSGGRPIQPVYDLTVPPGRWLRARDASIEAEIFTNQDMNDKKAVDKIMTEGLYLYPDYSDIGRLGQTVIVAGHHYNMFVSRKESQQTFQNLDKVKVGDLIELIDDYKVWTYEVFRIEQGETISPLGADLIAYTCVYWWDSNLRLFVYARLVE